MDDVEEDLPLEGEAARLRLAARRVRREDDLAQELVALVLERERDHVRRSRDGHEVPVDPRDRPIVDERDRETALRPALGAEHETRERLEARAVQREASLLVGDLDAGHGAG